MTPHEIDDLSLRQFVAVVEGHRRDNEPEDGGKLESMSDERFDELLKDYG